MNLKITQKPKFECMNIEDMKVHEPYAFTLSPSKEFLYVHEGKDTLSAVSVWTRKLIQALNVIKSADFEKLNFELSKTGRPHVHGYIIITDVVAFYGRDLRFLQDMGTYKIAEIGPPNAGPPVWIEHQNIWDKYIHKQSHLYNERDWNVYNSKEIQPWSIAEPSTVDIIRQLRCKDTANP